MDDFVWAPTWWKTRETRAKLKQSSIKGVNFLRNGGAASVGEYNKIIWFY